MALQEKAKKVLLKQAEVASKEVVEALWDDAVLEAKEAVKKAIPGQVDDVVIDLVVSTFAPKGKEVLLAKIAQISEEV
jgi:hypothetical protein